MMQVDVYGSLISLPEGGEAENWGTSIPSEQYWRRKELPEFFEIVEYDKEGTLVLTEQQEIYATEEVRRCREGFYFYNNGILTYITGKNYFYLQWWKLEDDIYPNYRDTDRRYFLFLNHWEHISWCLGIFRGKKRREGASSQATANLVYECIFFTNSNCGLISKTKDDSKDTFTDMAAFGYRQLPPFLKPKQLNKEDTVSELLFANKATSTKGGYAEANKYLGHRSKLNFRAPVLNAYDRGRITRLLADEGGKWPSDVPFSRFIAIVSKTMIKGGFRVGFCEAPSTVNEMTKGGGEEFSICWKNANQFKYNGMTPNGFVTYFSPAYDGYDGFIDKHGMSVIESPTEEQFNDLVAKNSLGQSRLSNDDLRMGAKAYLLKIRRPLTGTQLEEEIRQNPFDEEEMFMYAGFNCEFSAANIQRQIAELEDEPIFLRQQRLVLSKREIKSIFMSRPPIVVQSVNPMDDAKGGWFILSYPTQPNAFEDNGGYLEPQNTSLYTIGVDTTKELPTGQPDSGSKPRIVVFMGSLIVDGEETGMKPVAMYLADSRLDVHFDEEVMKACMWYGCRANYEIDARSDYYRYFVNNKAGKLLEWTPKVMRNPVKKGFKIEPGTRSGDPFQFAQQLQLLKAYVDGTSQDEYNGHVHRIAYPSLLKQLLRFDNSDRTKSDEVIALAMALAPIFTSNNTPAQFRGVKEYLPTHKIKIYA